MEVLYSFANSVDTNFALPAGYAAFPFTSSALLAGAGGTTRTVWPLWHIVMQLGLMQ